MGPLAVVDPEPRVGQGAQLRQGFEEVPDDDAVMKQFTWTTTFSAAERFHGPLAYEVGRGRPLVGTLHTA